MFYEYTFFVSNDQCGCRKSNYNFDLVKSKANVHSILIEGVDVKWKPGLHERLA